MPGHPKTKTAIVSALGAALLSLSIGAAERPQVPQRVVKFADLDLTRGAGVAALYARIQAAAAEVCEPVIARDLASASYARTCTAAAIGRAIADVNVPQLTSYHMAKSRTMPRIRLADRD